MDTAPFVSALHDLNTSFVKLLDSMSALRGLSSLDVAAGLDERTLLEAALEVLMHNHELERCSVYLLEKGQLVNAAGLDWEDLIGVQERQAHRAGRAFAIGEGVIGLAASTGQQQHCRNCGTDERFVGQDGVPVANLGSLISTPIRANGELLGVLNVSHPHAEFFTDTHERALSIFANFLGRLVLNNRLFNRMEPQVRQRTAQLEAALAEAEELKRRYAELSVIDELTGLHNRRFFFPEARAALARAMRHDGAYTLLLVDIDHFKLINDSIGHAAGDAVLRQIAEIFSEQIREGDILARFGGEEFIVALPETDTEGARQVAERMREAVKEHFWEYDGKRLSVTLSVGLAALTGRVEQGGSGAMLDRLVSEADQALYFGKHNGRDQCQVYAEIACEL